MGAAMTDLESQLWTIKDNWSPFYSRQGHFEVPLGLNDLKCLLKSPTAELQLILQSETLVIWLHLDSSSACMLQASLVAHALSSQHTFYGL